MKKSRRVYSLLPLFPRGAVIPNLYIEAIECLFLLRHKSSRIHILIDVLEEKNQQLFLAQSLFT